MSKNRKLDLGLVFSAATFVSGGNPDLFMAAVKCFLNAAQQADTPYWNQSANTANDQHAAKARLLTRDHHR